MKRALFFLMILFALSSCLTVGKIERNCDKFLKVCGTEKERIVEYRDTIIEVEKMVEVPVPFYGDSVRIRDSVNVVTVVDKVSGKEKQVAQMDTTYKEFGLIAMQVWVNNSGLGADAWLKDSTIWWKYHDWIKVINGIKDSKEKVVVPVKYVPGFYRFTFGFFWAVAAIAVFIVLKTVTGIGGIIKRI